MVKTSLNSYVKNVWIFKDFLKKEIESLSFLFFFLRRQNIIGRRQDAPRARCYNLDHQNVKEEKRIKMKKEQRNIHHQNVKRRKKKSKTVVYNVLLKAITCKYMMIYCFYVDNPVFKSRQRLNRVSLSLTFSWF